jgi:hypothetical protein
LLHLQHIRIRPLHATPSQQGRPFAADGFGWL